MVFLPIIVENLGHSCEFFDFLFHNIQTEGPQAYSAWIQWWLAIRVSIKLDLSFLSYFYKFSKLLSLGTEQTFNWITATLLGLNVRYRKKNMGFMVLGLKFSPDNPANHSMSLNVGFSICNLKTKIISLPVTHIHTYAQMHPCLWYPVASWSQTTKAWVPAVASSRCETLGKLFNFGCFSFTI